MLQSISCHAVVTGTVIALFLVIPKIGLYVFLMTLAWGGVVRLCYMLGTILDKILPRRSVASHNKAVFITGCDTGFGQLLAQRLDSKGYRVFAGCLFPSGPDAQKLKSTTTKKLRIVGVDVTKDESVQRALKVVKEELGTSELWAVVNNAGIMIRGDLEWTPLADQIRQFDVNTFGVIRVTQAFLPILRKFKGRVVTTVSMGGRITTPGFAHYSMTKHATLSFCDGLRQEMEKWDVKVVSVEPFSYTTAMTDTNVIHRSSDATWSKVPDSIKEDYGYEYIEEFKKALTKFNDATVIKGNKKVIDCLEEAVTARSPQNSYSVGDIKAHIGFWLLQVAPPTLGNAYLRSFLTFTKDLQRYLQARNQSKTCSKKSS